jgi:hypothetical protein
MEGMRIVKFGNEFNDIEEIVSEGVLLLLEVGDEEGGDLFFYLREGGVVFVLFSIPVAFYYVAEIEEGLKTDL